MKTYRRSFLAILLLIGITSAAMAYIGTQESPPPRHAAHTGNSQALSLDAKLVQDKVLQGSDGKVSVALTFTGANLPNRLSHEIQPLDLTVVLDRSGSMGGQKIHDARMAVIRLMELLSPEDRMAIITYSNDVHLLSPLVAMNSSAKKRLSGYVKRIHSGGGTNLGGGLKEGIATLMHTTTGNRQRKVILISDGLANQGITDLYSLGSMAANGAEHNIGVSTVGVGYDFNEVLMTTIADHGSGSYYFLENPQALAQVFRKEFETARNVVAGGVELLIPLHDGIELIDAGGYPISKEGNIAIIRPGDLLSGQERRLFLTFQMPTTDEREFTLADFRASYLHEGKQLDLINSQKLAVHCVADQKEVVASIDEAAWSEQVVKEDYGRLKDEVAAAIRKGKKEEALETIQEYEVKNRAINDSVGSSRVSQNLEKDVQVLRQSVEETFAGAPAAVAAKKKQQAKALQYESYQVRRDKK